MPRNKSGSANGGVIGKTNKTSFGKNTQTVITSTGNVCTQPGTRFAQVLIVAGGGGAGNDTSGGGGAGGARNLEIPMAGSTATPITIGAGGTGRSSGDEGGDGSLSKIISEGITYQSTGGGGGGGNTLAPRGAPPDGQPGGSGGGGNRCFGPCGVGCGGAGNTPPTSPPQGN